MRELPITVALSLAVHAAALTWFVTRDVAEEERSVTSAVSGPAPVETPELEVALLVDTPVVELPADDLAPRAPALAASSTRRTPELRSPTTGQPSTDAPPTTDAPLTTTAPPVAAPPKRSLLSMRDGRPEVMIHRPGSDGISDETLEQMVEGKIPVKIANLPGAQESADFEKVQGRLKNARWINNATPEQVAGALLEREAARQAKKQVELVAQRDGTYRSEKTTFTATTNRDGTVDLGDKKNWNQKSLFYAEFDVTDALMRKYAGDPYASEKLKFLDRTRDQRVEIGKRHRTAQLLESASLMAVNLRDLWSMTADPAKRKEELFLLWDDCAEGGEDELSVGGASARRVLLEWIRVKGVTFTPAELQAFNAKRTSKAAFSP